MNRRKALKGISIGASAGVFLPSLLTSCGDDDSPKPSIEYDGTIIIIGAGAAGLYAADLLISQGLSVIILEASDRIGGRVKSVRGFADFPAELGADIIKSQDSIFIKEIDRLNLNTIEIGIEREHQFYFNGQTLPASDWINHADFVAGQNFVNNIQTYSGSDLSVLEAAQEAGLSPSVYDIIEGQIANPMGSDLDKVGISGLKNSSNLSANARSIALANNPLQDVLFSRFNNVLEHIQFNTRVTSVSYGGEEVSVETDNGSFLANKVVLTAPVSIIKSGVISFAPLLPEAKIQALSRIGMDAAIKILIKFNRNFWGQNTFKIFGGNLVPMYTSAGTELSATNRTLIIEVFGKDAEVLGTLTEAEMKEAILDDLDEMFDGEARLNNEINEFVKMDWSTDPNIQGGYSYPLIGGTDEDRIVLAEPVNEQLYFAGEATSVNFGTLDGALESGARVTQNIIDHILKEQSP